MYVVYWGNHYIILLLLILSCNRYGDYTGPIVQILGNVNFSISLEHTSINIFLNSGM